MLTQDIQVEEPKLRTTVPSRPSSETFLDGDELNFAAGLPGLPDAHRFRVERLTGELEPFFLMRSVDRPEICFVLIAPAMLFPNYSIEIEEQYVSNLSLHSAEDAVVMLIITLGERPTANLLGPLVVNRHTGTAAQVVQYQSAYRAAEPLPIGGAGED